MRYGLSMLLVGFVLLLPRATTANQQESALRMLPFVGSGSGTDLSRGAELADGNITSHALIRIPDEWPDREQNDGFVFTKDLAAGLVVIFQGAAEWDTWVFKYYSPGTSPGSHSPFVQCQMQIIPPGEPGNPTANPILWSACPTPFMHHQFPGPCPCSLPQGEGLLLIIAGDLPADEIGVWTAQIDFYAGGEVLTPAVVTESMYLMKTPRIALVHGWESSCDAMGILDNYLELELGVAESQVRCFDDGVFDGFGYKTRDGVRTAGCRLDLWLYLNMSSDSYSDLHIVGHSMGGLVARWQQQQPEPCSPNTPPVNAASVTMLGTPNDGVRIAKLLKDLCPWYAYLSPAHAIICYGRDVANEFKDLKSQAIDDLAPGSDTLDELNEGFVRPPAPRYRAHSGRKDSAGGEETSGSDENDCFVSEDSVRGPNSIFDDASGLILLSHAGLSHADFGSFLGLVDCVSPTLTDSFSVVRDIAADIKATFNPGLSFAAAPPTTLLPSPSGSAVLGHVVDAVITVPTVNTHLVTVPAGLPSTRFFLAWPDSSANDEISIVIRRPNGQVVAETDPDVVRRLRLGGASMFYLQSDGYELSTPVAGEWTVEITGQEIGPDGTPYVVSLETDSVVSAAADVVNPGTSVGAPQVIRASLFDGATKVPSTVTATVLDLDGSEASIPLVDDGTNGDEAAGDLVYSGQYTPPSGCGTFRTRVLVSGATSEGIVSRVDVPSWEARVQGDVTGDPCINDEDADGCAETEEIGPTPGLGGARDPLFPWDFFDVPVPALLPGQTTGVRDKSIGLSDVLAILAYSGTSQGGTSNPGGAAYDSDLNANGIADGREYDRRPSTSGNAWQSGSPDGSVSLQDALVALSQTGHSCVAAP